ncbi:hypothetical protein DMUE_2151 [Dictyocoela muelleri]|nr:hypothetical protein DMUE_2151 [Dictyocoela muelleri]
MQKIISISCLFVGFILLCVELLKVQLLNSFYRNQRNSHSTSYMINNLTELEIKVLITFLCIQLLSYNLWSWIISAIIFSYEVKKRRSVYLLSSFNFKNAAHKKYVECCLKSIFYSIILYFIGIKIFR